MAIAICMDCNVRSDQVPEDWICPHLRPEHWVEKGFVRNWGDAAVMRWPIMEILRREKDGDVDYVILSMFLRRPVTISGKAPSWGGY